MTSLADDPWLLAVQTYTAACPECGHDAKWCSAIWQIWPVAETTTVTVECPPCDAKGRTAWRAR
jgi:endogenous inhibitor of DNA gyrase (YacG/DUF329 family)